MQPSAQSISDIYDFYHKQSTLDALQIRRIKM